MNSRYKRHSAPTAAAGGFALIARKTGPQVAVMETARTMAVSVELDEQVAASWTHGSRHITLIGVRDVAEVSQMMAWLDEKKRPGPS